MLESGSSGSVRGCPAMGIPTAILGRNPPVARRSTDGRLRRILLLAARSGEGLLTEPTVDARIVPGFVELTRMR